MTDIEVDDYILDAQLVKNMRLERSVKLRVSTLLLGLSALKELASELGISLNDIDRKHIFKAHAGIELTDSDIVKARDQARKKLNQDLDDKFRT